MFFTVMDKRKLVGLFIVEQGMVIGLVLGVAIGYKMGDVKMGVVYGLLGGAVLGGVMALLARVESLFAARTMSVFTPGP